MRKLPAGERMVKNLFALIATAITIGGTLFPLAAIAAQKTGPGPIKPTHPICLIKGVPVFGLSPAQCKERGGTPKK
jgi:hypothetical protein